MSKDDCDFSNITNKCLTKYCENEYDCPDPDCPNPDCGDVNVNCISIDVLMIILGSLITFFGGIISFLVKYIVNNRNRINKLSRESSQIRRNQSNVLEIEEGN